MGEIELGAAAEATVQAYRELALDSDKRLALSLDNTCIQFLAYVIAEGIGSLAQLAVNTLELIAKSPECRSNLARTFGVLEALQEMADDERYSEELRNQASSLFICLQFSLHAPSKNTSGESSRKEVHFPIASKPTDSTDNKNIEPGKSLFRKMRREAKSKSFLGSSNVQAKTVTLFIAGMSRPDQRKEIEDELVRVRGLISIVFDLQKARVTCRVKRELSAEKLAAAVKRLECYEAKQVINGPDGEMLVSMGPMTSPSTTTHPISEELPDYLPEEESPHKDSGQAMAPSGSFREAASTFFSTAANVLQNSFYW